MDRQYIIDEIRRTANENGGVPLGKMKFLRATGIKDADWLGKFWVRWTDAVQEAGFAGNTLQGAYDETALLEKYISLVRELKAIPTSVQLKFKARHDRDFPWHNTFSRFG